MTAPTIIDAPSPNHDARDAEIDTIILHYTGMQSGAAALDRLRSAEARVSAHYLIEEDGRIFRLVPEDRRAWHAGVSAWRGASNINARSIGVEIVNPGHEWGYRPFPEAQVASLLALLDDVRSRRTTPRNRVLGHSDVAPARKEDPGERFPWAVLADAGHAVGPYAGPPDSGIPYQKAEAALPAIGYDAPKGAHAAALLAFQRRFAPTALGQGFSPLTKAALLWAEGAMRDAM